MVQQVVPDGFLDYPELYPDSDGEPMADNTKQFRWIVTIKENLERLFSADSNVFVAGDLLWYPVKGDPKRRQAPDVLVVFGRPKGDRGSYKQWEEGGIAPRWCLRFRHREPTGGDVAKAEFLPALWGGRILHL